MMGALDAIRFVEETEGEGYSIVAPFFSANNYIQSIAAGANGLAVEETIGPNTDLLIVGAYLYHIDAAGQDFLAWRIYKNTFAVPPYNLMVGPAGIGPLYLPMALFVPGGSRIALGADNQSGNADRPEAQTVRIAGSLEGYLFSEEK